MIIEIFSSNVKHFRKEKNYTQEKLAELSGLHRTYIGGIELGKRNVSIETLEKIAKALEIPSYYLLKEFDWSGENGKF